MRDPRRALRVCIFPKWFMHKLIRQRLLNVDQIVITTNHLRPTSHAMPNFSLKQAEVRKQATRLTPTRARTLISIQCSAGRNFGVLKPVRLPLHGKITVYARRLLGRASAGNPRYGGCSSNTAWWHKKHSQDVIVLSPQLTVCYPSYTAF